MQEDECDMVERTDFRKKNSIEVDQSLPIINHVIRPSKDDRYGVDLLPPVQNAPVAVTPAQ